MGTDDRQNQVTETDDRPTETEGQELNRLRALRRSIVRSLFAAKLCGENPTDLEIMRGLLGLVAPLIEPLPELGHK